MKKDNLDDGVNDYTYADTSADADSDIAMFNEALASLVSNNDDNYDDYDDYDNDDGLSTVQIESENDRVRIGTSSVIGRRMSQQDAVRSDDDADYDSTSSVIAVLCDGMGGLNGGEIASNFAAEHMLEYFHSPSFDMTDIPSSMVRAVRMLDKSVFEMKDTNGEPLKAGTTIVSVVIKDSSLYWCSVGDSRIYIVRNNEIICVTQDHNYLKILMEQVKKEMISEADALNHPKREALISYLGIGGLKYINVNQNPFELMSGDHIVLCSDGLYRCVAESEILGIINSFADDVYSAAEALTSFAVGKNNPHQDNTSAIVVKFLPQR